MSVTKNDVATAAATVAGAGVGAFAAGPAGATIVGAAAGTATHRALNSDKTSPEEA